jgi:NAD(P)-dependent dehydrogenase (short-subunit alcohol dehydrogenase family)
MSKPVAIVAGVGPGTGAAVARKFAKEYNVVLMARNPENYESLVKDIESSGGKATGISTDVASTESVKKAFEQVKSIGPVAVAVFNVGGRFIRKPFLELTEDDFDAGIQTNG